MSVRFNEYYFFFLLFSSDLKKVVLQKRNGKCEPFIIEVTEDQQANFSKITDFFLSQYKIKLEHDMVRIVTSLPNLDKTKRFLVVMTLVDNITEYEQNSNFEVVSSDNFPATCFPLLRWLIPLCIDPAVYGSCFNQIIMK